jgi:hypothetical protein
VFLGDFCCKIQKLTYNNLKTKLNVYKNPNISYKNPPNHPKTTQKIQKSPKIPQNFKKNTQKTPQKTPQNHPKISKNPKKTQVTFEPGHEKIKPDSASGLAYARTALWRCLRYCVADFIR